MSKIVKMEDGTLMDVRGVPPYVQSAVRQALPEPPFPSVTLTSKATGNQEVVPVLPGTPEYAEYRRGVAENQNLVRTAMTSFNLDYGVLRWKLPDTDEWVTEAPEDWVPPDMTLLKKLGVTDVSEFNTRRSMYIRFERLVTDADTDSVDTIIYSKQALTKEEIIAALSPFDLDEEIDLWKLRSPV